MPKKTRESKPKVNDVMDAILDKISQRIADTGTMTDQDTYDAIGKLAGAYRQLADASA